jgi:ELWxxDGT repeat protein
MSILHAREWTRAGLLGVVLFSTPFALPAQLVTDLSPGPATEGHQLIRAHALVGDRLLVEIQDPELAREMWGLGLGQGIPELLGDFDPSDERNALVLQAPTAVYWSGPKFALLGIEGNETGSSRRALWVTDGTPSGTRELSPSVQLLQVIGPVPGTDLVTFTAFEDSRGTFGLWVTDGRPEGTRSIYEAPARSGLLSGVAVTEWQGRLVFRGASLLSGEAFWQTDGTPEGTKPLVDFVPNADDPVVLKAVVAGDRLHFFAFPRGGAIELWQLASTDVLPRLLTTLAGLPAPARLFTDLEAVGEQLFFVVGSGEDILGARLWRWDERAAVPLEAVTPSFGPETEIWLAGADDDGVSLAFWVIDYSDLHEHRIWMSDGTVAGLRSVHSVRASTSAFRITALHHGEHGFVFSTRDPPSDAEIWRFEGASRSAERILTTPSGFGLQLVSIAGRAVFFAFEREATALWSSDGSPNRPELLFRVPSGAPWTTRCAVRDDEKVACFALDDELTGEVWSSDGTAASTRLARPGTALDTTGLGTEIGFVAAAGGGVYFLASGGSPSAGLWRTDGTATGTMSYLEQESLGGTVSGVVEAGNLDYIFVRGRFGDPVPCGVWAAPRGSEAPRCVSVPSVNAKGRTLVHQGQLYFVDGDGWFRSQGLSTAIRLGDGDGTLAPGPALAATSRAVYLLRHSSLWATDGTPAGTRQIVETGKTASHLVALGDRLFFNVAGTGGEPGTLWTSDGTESGTRPLIPYPEDRELGPITAVASRLFVVTEGPDSWEELWTVDLGSPIPELTMLRRLRRLNSEDAAACVAVGSRVVFSAVDSIRGQELWASDGTDEGTLPVADLWPGRLGSRPQEITALGGGLAAFSAADAERGREPWITDGTTAGTRRLADLSFGRRSSLPEGFVLKNGRLYFGATDGFHGRELFAVPLSGLPDRESEPPSGPWLTSPTVPGFRFKVRIGDAPGTLGVGERDCLPETVCVSGAVAGRAEAFLRVVGPRPNGRLWPAITKFTASALEVWIEQTSSGVIKHYRLEGASPGIDELPGFFDRDGFSP